MNPKLHIFLFSLSFLIGTVFAYANPGLPRPLRDVSLLVYYSGDNNLTNFFKESMERLVKEGGGTNVHIVVQFDGNEDNDSIKFSLDSISVSKKLKQIIYEENIEYDMGNSQTLIDFVSWGRSNFPAKKTILIVSGHGRGILNVPVNDGSDFGKKNSSDTNISMASSSDDTSHSYMNEEDMVNGLKSVLGSKKIDLLIYNSCMMGSLEVMNLFSSIARYAIASEYPIYINTKTNEADIKGRAISIERIAQYLKADSHISEIDLGKKIIKDFEDSYIYFLDTSGNPDVPMEAKGFESTLALYDLNAIGPLSQAFTAMTQDFTKMVKNGYVDIAEFFKRNLTSYYVDSLGYIDSLVLYRNLADATFPQSSKSRIKAYEELNAKVVLAKATLHADYAHSNGELGHLSFFLPPVTADDAFVRRFQNHYEKLSITKQYGWSQFLTFYWHIVSVNSDNFWLESLKKWNQGGTIYTHPNLDRVDVDYFFFVYMDLLVTKWFNQKNLKNFEDYENLLNSVSRSSDNFQKHKDYSKLLKKRLLEQNIKM